MDITELIRELKEQRRRVERTIAALEAIWDIQAHSEPRSDGKPTSVRRGRKAMPEPERQEVSKRMKEYWAAWRRERAAQRRRGGGGGAAAGAGSGG